MAILFETPQMYGIDDFNTVQEIRRYIYKLVDQLQFAFNSLDQSYSIAETGTGNGWIYKKLTNGVYEMFGSFTLTAAVAGAAIGSLYRSEEFTLSTPFRIENAVITGNAQDCFALTFDGQSKPYPQNSIKFRLCGPTPFKAGKKIIVNLHVSGKNVIDKKPVIKA